MIKLPPLALPERPYRGIDFFRFVDQPIFFAREEETKKLVRLVTIYRGSLCFGDSGSGKSSLINAGLIPEMIKEGFLPERIRVQPVMNGECVIERIALTEDGQPPFLPSRFAAENPDAPRLVMPIQQLIEQLPLDASGGERAPADEAGCPLLIFDQFEELITLFEEAPQTREAFDTAATVQSSIIDALASLLRPRDGVPARLAKILFVFRDDYFAKLSKLFVRVPSLRDQHLRLTAPTTRALPRIIRGPFESEKIPAGHFSHEVSEALAAKLVAALEERSESGFLNLTEVQIACATLWEDPTREQAFERAATKSEVVQRLLEAYLEDALQQLQPDREAAVALLSHLVTNSGTRNIVSEEDLLSRVAARDSVPAAVATRTLKNLVEKTRLVRRQRRYDTAFYDIASEFLVPWIRQEKLRRDAIQAAEESMRAGKSRMLYILVGVFALALGWSSYSGKVAKDERERAEASAKKAKEQGAKAEQALLDAQADRATAEASRESESRLRKELEDQLSALKASQATTAAAKDAQTKNSAENERAGELLRVFAERARPLLPPDLTQRLHELEGALRVATESAKSGAEATTKAIDANTELASDLTQVISDTKSVATKPPRPANVAWAYYGLSNGDGTWTTRYFKKAVGNDAEIPQPGDEIIARADITIRKDVIRYQEPKGFVNAPALGVIKKKQRIKVLEVRGPNDEDVAGWATIWVTFELP